MRQETEVSSISISATCRPVICRRYRFTAKLAYNLPGCVVLVAANRAQPGQPGTRTASQPVPLVRCREAASVHSTSATVYQLALTVNQKQVCVNDDHGSSGSDKRHVVLTLSSSIESRSLSPFVSVSSSSSSLSCGAGIGVVLCRLLWWWNLRLRRDLVLAVLVTVVLSLLLSLFESTFGSEQIFDI